MTSNHIWSKIRKTFGEDNRMQEYSRLSHLGLLEVFCSSVEHYIRYRETEDFISLGEHFTGNLTAFIQFLSHTGILGALPRENIYFLHNYHLLSL